MMSDNFNVQDDNIERRHKKERKELLAKVTNLKRSMAKGDKKRKREIAEEVAKLEADIERRHDVELASVDDQKYAANSQGLEVESTLKTISLNDGPDDATTAKVSKAQKRRNKKEQKGKERDELIREQEELNLSGARHLENEKLKSVLSLKGLQYYEIPSDGDCLYGAVSHQLSQHGVTMNICKLRKKTAEFIWANKDEFAPFLCDQDTGLPFTNEMFESYCEAIETTPAWGGQLELRAISQVLKRPIEILQAEGQHITLGEEFHTEPLVVTYHRHAYNLGEHFNSVSKVSESALNDAFS